MIRAVYRNGTIQAVDAVPFEWQEGQELEIRPVRKPSVTEDTDDWINERGAYANYTGEMPAHVREELDRRLAELQVLGLVEFEPGEQEDIEKWLAEMDRLGRTEMQRLMEGRWLASNYLARNTRH